MRVNEFHIFRINTSEFKSEKFADDPLQLIVASDDDLLLIQKNPHFKTPEVFIKSYLQVSQCFIGIYKGEPAHIMWVFKKGDDSRLFNLKEGEAELNFCFTPEVFRGEGIYTGMIKRAVGVLGAEGNEICYMATHSTNIPSHKAILKAGFKYIGRLKNYGILFRPKWKNTGEVR